MAPRIVESKPADTAQKKCQIVPGGFAGTGPTGSFFESPAWVDKTKSPGLTSQAPAVAPPYWWVELITGKFLFFSPNLVWLGICLVDYFCFPYDLNAAKSFEKLDWVFYRFLVNLAITFGYAGFWHCVLYVLGWSKRPFHSNRVYKFEKVIHNMWYTFLGVVQYTVWEAIFMYCY